MTTDGATTQDGCGKEGWKKIDQARAALAEAEHAVKMAAEYNQPGLQAANKARDAAKKKLYDLEFFWLDSADARSGADLAAINQANAEHYARQGAPVPTEPIAALPKHVTPQAINQRNAAFWGGSKQ